MSICSDFRVTDLHDKAVILERQQAFAPDGAPEFGRHDSGSCQHLLAIRNESCSSHLSIMTLKCEEALARLCAPNSRLAVIASC